MTSTINFRSNLSTDTLERDTVTPAAAPVEQPGKGGKRSSSRRMAIVGAAAVMAAVGIGGILQANGADPTGTTPAVSAGVTNPGVGLPTNLFYQDTTSAVATQNAGLPTNWVQEQAAVAVSAIDGPAAISSQNSMGEATYR